MAAANAGGDRKKPFAQMQPDEAAVAVALAAVKELPEPDPSLQERMAELRRLTIRTANHDTGRAAIEAAARLRLMMGSTNLETDRKITGIIARFLVWSAVASVIDPIRSFTRANVNRYLDAPNFRSERGNQQRRYILYAAGRCLHPAQFPPPRTPVAERKSATSAPKRSATSARSSPDFRVGLATVSRYSWISPTVPVRGPPTSEPSAAQRLAAS